MKLFWAIILLFIGIAIGVAWLHLTDRQQSHSPWAQDEESAMAMTNRSVESTDQRQSPRFAEDLQRSANVEARALSSLEREDDASETEPDETVDIGDSEGTGADDRDPKQELVDDLLKDRDDDETPHSAPGSDPAAGDPGTSVVPDIPDGPPMAPGDHEDHTDPQQAENPWKDGAPVNDDDVPARLEHSVEKRDDGAIVLDNMFEIKGSGTRNDPYQVTWDLLMSAAETYQPRLGMDEIPERIKMLDGRYVQITGHLLFPMASFETNEVLVMLNMWDGCCLGTMPSPYDAIEVQLSEPVRANARQAMSYGSLTGRLSVDPYLINDWLIGLYVVEDGTLRMDM